MRLPKSSCSKSDKGFSDIATAIFTPYDPKLVQKSIDEAYLNITGYLTEREAQSRSTKTHMSNRKH